MVSSLSLSLPVQLPISAERRRIVDLLRRHQVVVVCGETGSGKSTQLAKLCLSIGRGGVGQDGRHRIIGHTQPRRIATFAVASRIADELGTPLGGLIGYEVRFTKRLSRATRVKVMTDGILLAELEGDARLSEYDTLIIDEAHERTLNIDLLLGHLKGLLAVRAELKLIITSATIDPHRFAAYFNDAPVVEVSGRMHAVDIQYRPPPTSASSSAPMHARSRPRQTSRQQVRRGINTKSRRGPDIGAGAAANAHLRHLTAVLAEVVAHGPGDVLIFFPGERDIRDARRYLARHGPSDVQLLPLYARLPATHQHTVFRTAKQRRIILATNVAETSITVPGVRYVIDGGVARLSRYSTARHLQQLPVERISQAAAQQRAGRCGRVADGVCYRLYSEEDFAARAAFTEPQIKRASLADIILRFKASGWGEVQDFAFLDAPSPAQINDGLRLLHELQAVDDAHRLTDTGKQMARLPLHARTARMVLSAVRHGCLRDTLIVVAGLSVAEPQLLPQDGDEREAALECHRAFAEPSSDFLSMVRLWDAFHEQTAQCSQAQLRKFCEANYLSWARFREWRDVHRQLKTLSAQLVQSVGTNNKKAKHNMQLRDATIKTSDGFTKERARNLHRALLSGLIGNVGVRSDNDAQQGTHPASRPARKRGRESITTGGAGTYQGAHGRVWRLHPSSVLHSRPPKWMMAAELVETTRVYARCAATVEPQWLEQAAGALVRRDYFDAYWNAGRGRVMGYERVSLYGLVLRVRRRVDFSAVQPTEARRIFIKEGLVASALHINDNASDNQDTMEDGVRVHAFDERNTKDDSHKKALHVGRGKKYVINAHFYEHNRRQVQAVRALEIRTRRRDLLVSDEALYAFYDNKLPPSICSAHQLETYLQNHKVVARALCMQLADITTDMYARSRAEHYPLQLQTHIGALSLSYRFMPGEAQDGVCVHVPLALLNQLSVGLIERLVPGLLAEKVTALFRTLPKARRRQLGSLAELTTRCLEMLDTSHNALPSNTHGETSSAPCEATLGAQLAAITTRTTSVPVRTDDFDASRLPPHLKMKCAVVDEHGKELARSDDLSALQQQLGQRAAQCFRATAADMQTKPLASWPASTRITYNSAKTAVHNLACAPSKTSRDDEDDAEGDAEGAGDAVHSQRLRRWGQTHVPQRIALSQAGHRVYGYPGLEDQGDAAVLRVFDTIVAARAALPGGVRRLLLLETPALRRLHRTFPQYERLGMLYMSLSLGTAQDLLNDMKAVVITHAFFDGQKLPRTPEDFYALQKAGVAKLQQISNDLATKVDVTLVAYQQTHTLIAENTWRGREVLRDNLQEQLRHLIYAGFVQSTPSPQLARLACYLKAMHVRTTCAAQSWQREVRAADMFAPYWQRYLDAISTPCASASPASQTPCTSSRPAGASHIKALTALQRYRWLLEEWRVSLFAQELGTAERVSEKRVRQAWQDAQIAMRK